MAEPAPKRTRVLSEERRKKKRESDRQRNQTRVNLGKTFTEWRELKEREGCKLDADLARLLLDCYSRWQTSTPGKARVRPPLLPVSSLTEDSDHDRCASIEDLGVLPLPEKDEAVALESSMHSMSIVEDLPDSPDEEEATLLKNTIIEMDDFWGDAGDVDHEDSSDEDFVPSIYLRYMLLFFLIHTH